MKKLYQIYPWGIKKHNKTVYNKRDEYVISVPLEGVDYCNYLYEKQSENKRRLAMVGYIGIDL